MWACVNADSSRSASTSRRLHHTDNLSRLPSYHFFVYHQPSMPSSTRQISPIEKAALLECFQEATRLVPPELRPQFILIGGAASIAYSSCLWTEDVDVAASPEAIFCFLEAVRQGARKFKICPCHTIEFDSRLEIIVKLEFLELGGSFVESIVASEPFQEGFLASPADLLLLRAVTVVDRGEDGDVEDFKWLLALMAKKGSILPELGGERLKVLVEAAGKLTRSERILLLLFLSPKDWAKFIL